MAKKNASDEWSLATIEFQKEAPVPTTLGIGDGGVSLVKKIWSIMRYLGEMD
jgi:hypothetical protein